MKKTIIAILLALIAAPSASAATYYRNKYITVASMSPCMMEISEKSIINANFISEVFKDDSEKVLIRMVNGEVFRYKLAVGKADHIIMGILGKIEECRSNK